MNFDGIEIDMLFAKLTLKEIPDTMVNNILYLYKNCSNLIFYNKFL